MSVDNKGKNIYNLSEYRSKRYSDQKPSEPDKPSLTNNKELISKLVLENAHESVDKSGNTKKLSNLVAKTAIDYEPKHEVEKRRESLINRLIFAIVDKRYPGITDRFRSNHKEFFAKQFKCMIAILVIMTVWVFVGLPMFTSELAETVKFVNYFNAAVSIFLYMLLGVVIFRVSIRQGLLDLLQMHRVSQKKLIN